MRRSVLPAIFLSAGLLLAPAAAQAAPCDGKLSCSPTGEAHDPQPTQPGLAPEIDLKPAPKPVPTRTRETHVDPAPAPPAPEVQAPEVQAPQPAAPKAVPAAPKATSPASDLPEPTVESTGPAAQATSSPTPSASPRTATPSPSRSSNWNTPVDKGQPTQAAVLASNSFSGPNMLGLFGILGGVLLVGLGGLAFALWSKNRLSSH